MAKLLFGSDPEFGVVDKEGNVVPVPFFIYSKGILPIHWEQESKNWSHPVMLKGDGVSVMMDGVAFEMTLKPTSNAVTLYQAVQDGLSMITDMVAPYGYHVDVRPSLPYQFEKYFVKGNALLEHCGIFGCDKDEDAFLGDKYESPELDVRQHGWRYFGGHLHMSDYNVLIPNHEIGMIKMLAMTVGNYCIANSPYPEDDKKRAFKYGQPGRFRKQAYPDGTHGVEYRSPSNNWITKLDMIEGVFYWANKAYELYQNKRIDLLNQFADSTINAIANVDQSLSKSILAEIKGV